MTKGDKNVGSRDPPVEPRSLPRPVAAVLIPANPMENPQFVVDHQSGFFEILKFGLRAAESREKNRGSPHYEPRG